KDAADLHFCVAAEGRLSAVGPLRMARGHARGGAAMSRPSPAAAALIAARETLARLLEQRERASDLGHPGPSPAVIEAAEKAVEIAERKVAKRRRALARSSAIDEVKTAMALGRWKYPADWIPF